MPPSKNKPTYTHLCKTANLPLFHRPWYLDAACGPEKWGVALAFDGGGEAVGAMPYYLTRYYGLRVVRMPPLAPRLGPWIVYPERLADSPGGRQIFEKQVLGELVGQLPRAVYFLQNCHYGFTNWLPFYWEGFRQTTRYSYILNDLSDLDKIYYGFKSALRNNIRKAAPEVEITRSDDIDLFYDLCKLSYKRRKLGVPFPLSALQRIDEALRLQNRRALYIARDRPGRPIAGGYFAWDDRMAYCLALAFDPAAEQRGASHLLLWQAIRDAAAHVNVFDFEGSMIRGLERFYAAFGGEATPYFQLKKWVIF